MYKTGYNYDVYSITLLLTCLCRYLPNYLRVYSLAFLLTHSHLHLFYAETDCFTPSDVNGAVLLSFNDTKMAAVVSYQCLKNGAPTHKMDAVCLANGSWSYPDCAGHHRGQSRQRNGKSVRLTVKPKLLESITCALCAFTHRKKFDWQF